MRMRGEEEETQIPSTITIANKHIFLVTSIKLILFLCGVPPSKQCRCLPDDYPTTGTARQ